MASPPIRHPCYYGIDFPSRNELAADGRTLEQIREYLGVDSLAYLSLEGMLAAAKAATHDFCHACFSGDYPIPIDPTFQKDVFERRQLRFFDAAGLLTPDAT